jgi:hypothetical protein
MENLLVVKLQLADYSNARALERGQTPPSSGARRRLAVRQQDGFGAESLTPKIKGYSLLPSMREVVRESPLFDRLNVGFHGREHAP